MSNTYGAAPPPIPGSPGGDDDGESLRRLIARYWNIFRVHYWIVLIVALASITAAYFWTERQPRVYQTSSKIIFHESKPNIFGRQIERVELFDPGGRWQFEQFWNTQKEVLQSKQFAKRVVKREGLLDIPGFIPLPSPDSDISEEVMLDRAAARVIGMSSVALQGDSRVGNVTVRASDPRLAALVANGIAETYVEYVRELQSGGVGQLATWFDTYVSTKRSELNAARSDLQEFQRDHNILSISFEERQRLSSENLQVVNKQLRDVRATRFQEVALLNQIKTMEKSGEDLRALADLVDNAALKRYLSREAELREELAQLKTRYLEEHPNVQATQRRLDVVQEHISNEINRIRSSVENRVAVITHNESNLEQELEAIKAEVSMLNEIGFEYTQMRDSTITLQQHYETVLKRSTELDINALYESDIIQVLENANVPGAPISPRLPLNLAVGLILGLGVGIGILVLIDAMDTTVKSDTHITQYTHRPILGLLPAVNPSALKSVEAFGDSPIDTLTHTAPKSAFAEGIKALRTNLMFMAPDNPPKLLLFTSPGPSEGKTLTSLNMAIALAQSGLKTLVIDSDMRRPRLHKAIGMDNKDGLSNAITEERHVRELVRKTEIENLEVLTCGKVPPNPSELLHSERFQKVLEDLKGMYDRIIFDSPPIGAVADALILSHSVDAVLLILKFGQTRQEALRRSIEQLEAIGAPFMGSVLNEISESTGYGYSYYYYRYRYDDEKPTKKGPTKLAS